MNEKTKIETDKLHGAYQRALSMDTPATLTDVCRLLTMSGLNQIAILKQLTDIRELLEGSG